MQGVRFEIAKPIFLSFAKDFLSRKKSLLTNGLTDKALNFAKCNNSANYYDAFSCTFNLALSSFSNIFLLIQIFFRERKAVWRPLPNNSFCVKEFKYASFLFTLKKSTRFVAAGSFNYPINNITLRNFSQNRFSFIIYIYKSIYFNICPVGCLIKRVYMCFCI